MSAATAIAVFPNRRPSEVRFLDVRGRRQAVRIWEGAAGARTVLCLHGWMDASITFQFLAEALGEGWRLVAPDWRGFGLTEHNGSSYFFPDYLGDRDQLLHHHGEALGLPQRLTVIGHSLGGHVACIYSGVRPERIERLISLEGFGMIPPGNQAAPERYRTWLNELLAPPPLRPSADAAAFATRLRRVNPRLTEERAAFLAAHLGQVAGEGWNWTCDPWHRSVNPILYRLEEVMACWREVRAPTLWVGGDDSEIVQRLQARNEEWQARLACFTDLAYRTVVDAGHMLHQDQAEVVAGHIRDFLSAE
jgi:pimeloyl-ACP methyl ester carboxylesterase